MPLGETLRKAREAKNLSTSEVASGTRMKVQTVQALEDEDFSKIAAPIYGKGFIKLYAEHVGIEPDPLIREYEERFVESKRPSLKNSRAERRKAAETKPAPPAEATGTDAEPDLFSDKTTPPPRGKQNRRRIDIADTSRRLSEGLGNVGPGLQSVGRGLARSLQDAGMGLVRLGRNAADFVRNYKLDLSDLKLTDSPVKLISVALGILILLIFIISGLSRCVRRPAADEAAAQDDIEELILATEPDTPYID